jgi:hypothetical protein
VSRARRPPISALAAVATAVAACDAATLVPPFDETPTVALLITPDPVRGEFTTEPDSGLFAVLVATGTPIRSPYLVAERFEMRRVSDGARFGWRAAPTEADAIPVRSFTRGNYFLPRQASPEGLGSDSIAPGVEYQLVVEVGRYRVTGRTRVPGAVQFVREPTDGDSIVRWRRAPGAAAYLVGGIFLAGQPIEDTVATIRPIPGAEGERLRVFAIDTNYTAFVRELRAARAGLSGGWGVFGAFTWAEMEVPTAGTAARR